MSNPRRQTLVGVANTFRLPLDLNDDALDIVTTLKRKGIVVKAASGKVLEEESRVCYKDVYKVADVSHRLGIGRKVMVSVPTAVAKG